MFSGAVNYFIQTNIQPELEARLQTEETEEGLLYSDLGTCFLGLMKSIVTLFIPTQVTDDKLIYMLSLNECRYSNVNKGI